jgi:hypothetical protein
MSASKSQSSTWGDDSDGVRIALLVRNEPESGPSTTANIISR